MAYSLGILGLGVMGRSLALNFHNHGFSVIGYDPFPKIPEDFPVPVADSMAELCASLEAPRRILMMVPAGKPVDDALSALVPLLSPGDVVIDGGNSYFLDTERRTKEMEKQDIHFVGMGVSGGEQGALHGPSMMPGGSEEAYASLHHMLTAVSAHTADGTACVAHMGPRGAGHYVKMVHNGIEYGDMQLIAEVYDFLHRGAGISNGELAEIFSEWNEGDLRSYLIEITANILWRLDEDSGESLVDFILDEAAQKGTGKWTSQNAFDVGAPIPTINAAVESRIISSLKSERIQASRAYRLALPVFQGNRERMVGLAEQALYASKITSYAQGFGMLKLASAEYGYGLQYAEIARIWRAGCIIRADLLEDIRKAYGRDVNLSNLLMDEFFREAMMSRQAAWREVLQTGIGLGIPMLTIGSSLAYFDAYRSERLPANLTQAQRDYFGAHTYRRIDRDGVFHTRWE